ncbi:MAG TPA: ATP-binding protein [Gemmatimonadaceae bacterium]|nr:ATP-binding protein [Gemmatimonadaceae bacterium]
MYPSLRMHQSSLTAVRLRRGARTADAASPGIRLAALRVPLAAKLVGANLIVVGILVGAWIAGGNALGTPAIAVIATVVLLHLALVTVALRPIVDLEAVAARVWRGDYRARVAQSNVADQEVLRIGSMFNILLDSMASDRSRMRELAAQVIEAGDEQRAAIARELHDSTAQQVAALQFQLSAAVRDAQDPLLAVRLASARDAAESILDQVRQLSQSVHPSVLESLGLEAALRRLARESTADSAIDFVVHAEVRGKQLPRNVEATLYRVAEEAIRNAACHSSARHVRVTLNVGSAAVLQIHDDGRGFDGSAVEHGHATTGLGAIRERLALVDGTLEVQTAVGGGTTITATVPLHSRPTAAHEGMI